MTAGGGAAPLRPSILMYAALLLGGLGYFYLTQQYDDAPEIHFATTAQVAGMEFSYEVIHDDITVDWSGGGDFDPRGKCPKDFFSAGFVLVYKKLRDGGNIKFLYHRAKQLLYRIDKDVIKNKFTVGLHWVTGTRFSAKYRVADQAYKGGKSVLVPTAKGGKELRQFQYGEVVPKNRIRPRRELFRETHIRPGQCPSWWDLIHFKP